MIRQTPNMWLGETATGEWRARLMDTGECRAIIDGVLRNEVEQAQQKRSGWEAS
jgi:hypothetical protein